MSSTGAPAALWGRVVRHNKLLNEQQWQQCAEAYADDGAKTPIGDVAAKLGLLKPQVARVITTKVEQLWLKLLDEAQSAASEPAQSIKVGPPDTTTAAPKTDDGPEAELTDDGMFALAEDLGDDGGMISRGSDLDWVDNAQPVEPKKAATPKEVIDFSDPDDEPVDTGTSGEVAFTREATLKGVGRSSDIESIDLIDDDEAKTLAEEERKKAEVPFDAEAAKKRQAEAIDFEDEDNDKDGAQ